MLGSSSSRSVSVVVQVWVFPAKSDTVKVTVWVEPLAVPKAVPATGLCTAESASAVAPVQLSEASNSGSKAGTAPWQSPGVGTELFTVRLAGQVSTGFSMSITVTEKEQVVTLPMLSLTENTTFVVPSAKVWPEAGPDS